MRTPVHTVVAARQYIWLELLPFFSFFILLAVVTANLPFFWDKDILFSRMAHWLLENRFSPVLPDSLDPGYPPALGYLLAVSWKIFGVNLPTAHLLMLPFTLGIVWQTRRFLGYFLKDGGMQFAMVLILADTTLLAQAVVFSTDLVMLFFMLLSLNAVIRNRQGWLMLAVTGLLFSHMRGLMVAATVGLFDLYTHGRPKNLSTLLRRIYPYLPALFLFGIWMVFHYKTKGWIGYHPASPWAACYELVDAAGFFRNVLIFIWRMGDFGRIFLWIVAGFLLYRLRKAPELKPLLPLLFLLVVSVLLTAPTMLAYKILNGHRYLIPVFYLLSVLLSCLLFGTSMPRRRRNILAAISLAALVSGNFWVYPDRIAKGWDATLAHLPYHHLRKKMIRFMDAQQIPLDQTGSEVPNTVPIDFIELNGDRRSFHRADLKIDRFVFYSNIYNMFTDEELEQLKQEWFVVKEYRCLRVKVILYRNPRIP